jgi:hypothetical protein
MRQSLTMSDEVTGDTRTLQATRYFRPVRDSLGPLALAEFLSPSSRLSIGLYRDEKSQRRVALPGTPATSEEVSEGASLSGRYVWRESGWFVGGAAQTADLDDSTFTVPPRTDFRSYRAFGGKYLTPRTSLELSLRASTTATDYPFTPVCALFAGCIDDTKVAADEIALSAMHVGTVGELTYTVSGSLATRDATLDYTLVQPTTVVPRPQFGLNLRPAGGVAILPIPVPLTSRQDVELGDVDTYSVASEFFPTRRVSARVGYTRWTNDRLRERGYELGVTWYFSRHAGLRVGVSRITNDLSPSTGLDHIDMATLQIIGRL